MFSSPQINQNMQQPPPYAMPPPPSAGPYAMPQPYAMPPPSPGPYAMPPQYAPVGYCWQQQYCGQQQYGVQQLYPPQNSLTNVDDKFGTISVLMPILCCGGPVLLASIGLYCTVQGKVKNDIASLFCAGMALLALSLVLFCISCVWICKNPPSSASCLSAMMGMNTCVQCCSLAARCADMT